MIGKRLTDSLLKKYEIYDFSLIKEKKVFLVGSIRFKDYFIEIESILQIVHQKFVSICSVDGLLHKSQFSEEEWDALQGIALAKLQEQDAILVLNVDGYIGKQSREEIEFFKGKVGKPIYYLTDLSQKEV